MADLVDFVVLSLLPSWCWFTIADSLRTGDSPAHIARRFCDEHWRDRPDYLAALRSRAAIAVGRGAERGLRAITWSDAAYPLAPTTISDPPAGLWARRQTPGPDAMSVAVVGSRAASPYALSVAEQLAFDLSRAGLVVVSGLARGVDSAAHRGTIAAGGATIAVLGSGADVIYPKEHEALASEIEKAGAVVSELAPGAPPLAHFFPLRNRIISGLSRAVIVVEANEKSGSLITARCALEQGRDVLAVPGNVLSGRNRGSHALLRDGAKIVESADDILEELGMLVRPRLPFPAAPPDPVLASLTPGEPSDLDTIADRSGLSPAKLLPRLFELELRGSIARVGGGRFVRVDRSC